MVRQIDLRNPSVNQITPARTNELHRAADEVSDQLLGDHTLRIEGFDAITGNPSLVASEAAPPIKGNYVQRALSHVMEINPALGFAPTQAPEFISDPLVQTVSSGAVAVNLHQQYKGIRIFQVAPTVRFNPDGSLAESAGSVVTVADDLDAIPKLKVTEAVIKAAQYIAEPQPDEDQEVDQFGEPLAPARVDASNFTPQVIAAFTNNPEMPTVLAAGPFAEEIKASLLWFALDKSNLRLTWEILITMPGFQEQYRTLVDTENGQILYCKQLVAAMAARGSVFLTDGAGERQAVSFPRDLADYNVPIPGDLPGGFPDAWVAADGSASGNAVLIALNGNPASVQGVDQNGTLIFDIADQTSDDQKLLNLFYYVNFIHNFFYLYGFRESDGNFQKDNFGRGGLASDAVLATVYSQPVYGTANMRTRIDGMSPTMNMGLVSRTGLHTALDSSVVFHEFTHGVTNRLVGGPMNVQALEAAQSGGMGEGWSDYIACTINQSETVGTWVTGRELGIRGYRYDDDFPDNFGHLGTGRYASSPHAIGEIWCATLLAMNRRIGAHLGVQLVIDALKLSPVTPSFLDMRDSILRALDNKRLAGQLDEDEYQTARRSIWEVFARFAMGVNARSNGASLSGIVADFNLPDFLVAPAAPQPADPIIGGNSSMPHTNNLLGENALRLAEVAEWDAERREKFANVLAAIRIHGEELAKLPNVVAVRPGFRFHEGKITDQPCVTVSVQRKRDMSEIASPLLIPQKLGKVLVDVVPATPFDQIQHRLRQSTEGLAAGDSGATGEVSTILPGEEGFLESSAAVATLIPYEPPAAATLEAVEEEMTVICHASPDAGWRNLDNFLRGTSERLTATMYEFNAGYVLDSLAATFDASKNLNLILDGGAAATVGNPTLGDVSKDQVRRRLTQRVGNRFDFTWAAVADDGKTTSSFFPTAYHIKVAVRDGTAFWLSSGNWKRSGQPQLDPFEQPAGFNGWSFLRSQRNNREWHVIIENANLAELFETYITNDIDSAKPLQQGGAGFDSVDAMPDLFVPEEFFDDGGTAAFQQPTFFRERAFTKSVRVQPLLTPDKDDNGDSLFARCILEMIENAQEKIYFQNQSLKPSWNNAEYTRLFRALARKSRDENLDVRIIVSEYANLSLLASANFNTGRIRKQRECHNKGIIVDDQKVVVGSHNWTGQLWLQSKLINACDGTQLWSEEDLLNESDALVIQNNIAEKVVSELQPLVSGDDSNITAAALQGNPQAYKYYLQGRYYWKKRDKEDIQRAIDAFNQAKDVDPNYAPAYAGLADAYIVRSTVTYSPMPAREASIIAKYNAEQAIKIDDDLGESHAALGVVLHRYEWNWQAAEKEYRRSLELNPDYAQTYYWYSNLLAITGRTDEALIQSLKAQELDPFSPLADVNVGRVLYYARQYDKSYEQLTNALRKDPNNSSAEYIIGLIQLQKGKYTEALKIFEKLYGSDKKQLAAAVLGFTYGKMGRKADALKVLDDLEEFAKKNGYVPPQERAIIYLGLGDKNNAIFWFEKSYQEHSPTLVAIGVEPLFDDLRSDTRFQDIISRMNLNRNLTVDYMRGGLSGF